MATDCTYLYEEYPEVISADQLYQICHISKRKAKWLLEHGYIPCEDSGKKTRRYKIRLNDVIDYLRTLEAAPDLVATPVGAFNVKRKQLNPVAQICQKEFQRFLYNIWRDEADILRISDVQVLLGYMEMLQLDEAEYNLIKFPQRGVCLYKCGNERYLLEVHTPAYKEKLFGTAGGR